MFNVTGSGSTGSPIRAEQAQQGTEQPSRRLPASATLAVDVATYSRINGISQD